MSSLPDGARLIRSYRKRRCPKKGCRGRITRLKERMVGWEHFAVDVQGRLEALGPDGDHLAPVLATCGSCGHEWRLRGVRDITELLEKDR